MKFGRLSRGHNPLVPRLRAVLGDSVLPPVPGPINYLVGMAKALGAMLNDSLGCCTIAGMYHALQVLTFSADGVMDTEPDSEVLATYEHFGYVPGNPATDTGCVEQDVLNYWLNSGIPVNGGVNKLLAFVEIDVADTDNIKRAIYDCGVVYIGFNVPAFLEQGLMGAGSTWDVNPTGDNSIVGGHCVILAGFDAGGVYLVSWGSVYYMTWAFFAQFCDEAYALIDEDWIRTSGLNPLGQTAAQWIAAVEPLKQAA
jgi:hypothetical protein